MSEKRNFALRRIGTCLIAFAAFAIFCFTEWASGRYGRLNFEKILINLSFPLKGTEGSNFTQAIFYGLLPSLTLGLLFTILVRRGLKGKKFSLKLNMARIIAYLLLIVSLVHLNLRFKITGYAKNQLTDSGFIQENYRDPRSLSLSFPEQKRNLIYIYLESVESSFMNHANGGVFDENYITALTRLARENINFRGKDGRLTGSYMTEGASWTMAAMFAQTTGLPMKFRLTDTFRVENRPFYPGVYSLGQILQKEGYKNVLMVGSDAEFGGRAAYHREHGNYEIYDHPRAIRDGLLPEDYHVWWGFEDHKLFAYAKDKILELSKGDRPFNFSMLTVDTHFEDGYPEPYMKEVFPDNQYGNVLNCSSDEVAAFVDWVKEQPFFRNTTIVISGDHLTMDKDFCAGIPEEDRRVYHCIINPAHGVSYRHMTNRSYTTMDLFPTTLRALGVQIPGNRLGLGTDLFSGDQTIVEKIGIENLNRLIQLNSEFYNTRFLPAEDE